MKRLKCNIWKYAPRFSAVFAAVSVLSAAINIAYANNARFADFFNERISCHVRRALAYLTSVIPFSLAEFLLLSCPVVIYLVLHVCAEKSKKNELAYTRCLLGLLSIVMLLYSLFVWSFGAGYKTSSLDKKLGLTRKDVSAEELYDTLNFVTDRLNELDGEIIYVKEKGSVRPYSHSENVKLCFESYGVIKEKYSFIDNFYVPVKQLSVSDIMTYTHISGVYSFFTGEANLNTNYPYFVNVYTTAHEMAHQRGIAREDEANFIAYLVCINSDDPYMRYSGYLNMYEYLGDALYEASPELYKEAAVRLNMNARYDLSCYSEFFDKYRKSTAAKVSDAVNNTYLKIQGTPGTKSYGMVVDLAVAYYEEAAE